MSTEAKVLWEPRFMEAAFHGQMEATKASYPEQITPY